MNSSQRAQVILGALWLIATLSLASAQLRVLAKTDRRQRRYAIAWIVCTLLLGGVLSYVDNATGRVQTSARLMNFALAGTIGAAALAAGALMTRGNPRPQRSRSAQFLRLVVAHGVIVVLLGYLFL